MISPKEAQKAQKTIMRFSSLRLLCLFGAKNYF